MDELEDIQPEPQPVDNLPKTLIEKESLKPQCLDLSDANDNTDDAGDYEKVSEDLVTLARESFELEDHSNGIRVKADSRLFDCAQLKAICLDSYDCIKNGKKKNNTGVGIG